MIHHNFFNEEQLNLMRAEFDKHLDAGDLTAAYYVTDKDTIKEIFGKDDDTLVQQQRFDFKSDEFGNTMKEWLNPIVNLSSSVSIFFVRSWYPIGIHSDTERRGNQVGRTFLIPLTFDDRIKTIVWDKVLLNDDFRNFVNDFVNNPDSYEKVNSLSKEYDLRNCWFGDPSITDVIEVDEVATWEKGMVVEFAKQKIHASNNYASFLPFKDYILIHTNE